MTGNPVNTKLPVSTVILRPPLPYVNATALQVSAYAAVAEVNFLLALKPAALPLNANALDADVNFLAAFKPTELPVSENALVATVKTREEP